VRERQARLNDHCSDLVRNHRRESGVEQRARGDIDRDDGDALCLAGALDLFEGGLGEGIGRIAQRGYPAQTRQRLLQQFDLLRRKLRGQAGHPGNVAARMGEAGNDPHADWVGGVDHDDRDLVCCPLYRQHGRRHPGGGDINLFADELGGEFGQRSNFSSADQTSMRMLRPST